MTDKTQPTMHQVARKLTNTINGFLTGVKPSAGWRMAQELFELRLHRKQFYDPEKRALVGALRDLARRAEEYADDIEGDESRTLTKMRMLADRIADDTAQLRALVSELDTSNVLDAVLHPDTTPQPMKVIEGNN
jgi:hypothetical protein